MIKKNGKEYMSIGELAKKMNTTVRTLQYYDREGLLTPSSESESGRRLYTYKDMIQLHQIQSLKSLGFSLNDIKNKIIYLDTPKDVVNTLTEQSYVIQKQIDQLTNALSSIDTLKHEVIQMKTVDFKKYADIIVNLQMNNEYYWLIKHFDNETLDHIRNRFDKESGLEFMERFNQLNEKVLLLKKENVSYEDEKALELAKEFWGLILEFTNGDMSLLPKLMEFQNLVDENEDWIIQQKNVNEYLQPALELYFQKNGFDPFKKVNKMKNIIQIRNLIKSYDKNEVLKGCSFDVNQGEIFGILGVNGAGKTTMLECIEGFRKYDEGSIEINGNLGIQLQSASLPAYIQVKEIIQLISLWKHTKIDANILKNLDIDLIENKKYLELSTGQKRRLHLVLALIGEPDILILDEPTAGLDVEGRISLHEEMKKLKEKGKTILLTSHDMSEVENLCDRIAILNKGKIDFLGTVNELAQKVGKQYEIIIQTEFNEEIYMTKNIGDKMLEILQKYKSKNIEILDIKVSRGSLEQHFMNIAKGEQK